MSVEELNSLYDIIITENKESKGDDLQKRVSDVMQRIQKAHENGKRSVNFEHLENDVYAILRKSKFDCKLVHNPNGYSRYKISW